MLWMFVAKSEDFWSGKLYFEAHEKVFGLCTPRVILACVLTALTTKGDEGHLRFKCVGHWDPNLLRGRQCASQTTLHDRGKTNNGALPFAEGLSPFRPVFKNFLNKKLHFGILFVLSRRKLIFFFLFGSLLAIFFQIYFVSISFKSI